MSIENIIKSIVDRIRRLESIQEGNGFVPYFFIPQTSLPIAHGTHIGQSMSAEYTAYIEIVMPRKVENLSEANLIFIPNGTGTMDYTITTYGGYCGEDESNHNDSQTADGLAVTDDRLECLDISAALTPYAAGDIVGVKLYIDALATTTSILLLGIRLR